MSHLRRVTADTTAVHGELLLVDATAGNIVVTLPPAWVGLPDITAKKVDNSRNHVTVVRAGPALIDGATSAVLSNYNQAVVLVGDGTNWAATAAVVGTTPPATAPGAPTIGTAVAGVNAATVPYTPPTDDGGSAITGGTVTSTPDGITGTGASSPITVSGLTAGRAYTFTAHVTNAVGDSAESAASNSVTPTGSATAPGAPTIGTAAAGSGTATGNWTAPGSNGGSPITGYDWEMVLASDGTTVVDSASIGVALTTGPVTATAGTAVKFRARAVNAIGAGSWSALSNAVTPTPPLTGTQWVTGWTPQTLRNDFAANLGVRITVGASPISVTALGRWVHAGNSQTHTVKIVRASDEVLMASAVVATSGVTAGTFAETALGAPVTLAAGVDYYVLSSETAGGDQWGTAATSTTLTTTAVATADAAAYQDSSYTTTGLLQASYVPVGFRYA